MPRPPKPAAEKYPATIKLGKPEVRQLRALLGVPEKAESSMVEMVELALSEYFVLKVNAKVTPGNIRAGLNSV